ncbi:MAG: hypothetical protein HY685_06490 [Chloroflexi bacterium]|nr:hypothetical protein [Chloroflexota bacterium]
MLRHLAKVSKAVGIPLAQWLIALYATGGALLLPYVAHGFKGHSSSATAVAVFIYFFLVARFAVSKGGSLRFDWPFTIAFSVWLLFAVIGALSAAWLEGSLSLNLGLWLWWALFGLVPALIEGLYVIRANIDKRYFARVHSKSLNPADLAITLQYLKQIQDKWSSQMNWFTAFFVGIGITGVLGLLNLKVFQDEASAWILQWLPILAYAFVGVVLGIYGHAISIINLVIDRVLELERSTD